MLAQDPNDAFLRYGLAMDYAGGGDDEAAAKEFAELMRAAPDYVPAYLQAGQVLARLGRDDEARAVYRAGVAAAQKSWRRPRGGRIAGVSRHADVNGVLSPLSPWGRGAGGEGMSRPKAEPLTPYPSPPRGEGRKRERCAAQSRALTVSRASRLLPRTSGS